MTRALAYTALALAAALGGCSKARTEAVVVVTTDGLRVPDDVDAIDVRIADTTNAANPVFEKSFRICGGDVSDTCLTLPLNFTLIPGAHKDHSSRVQVTATRKTAPVIDNAAIFTFAEGQSLRLDFVLYANCLGNVDCAARDQACGPDAMCHPVPVTTIDGDPDLSAGAQDLAVANDLATPADFSVPGDLSSTDMAMPRDLTVIHDLQMPDLAGCVPLCVVGDCGPGNCGQTCTCSGSEVCQGTTCSPCGNVTQPCCAGSTCQGTVLHCYAGTCDVPDMASSSTDMSAPADKLLTWTSTTYDSGSFYGVWATGSDNAFVVGDKGTMGAIFKSTAGAAFAPDSGYSGSATLRAVSGASINDVWAAGDGATIVRYTGSTWGPPPSGNPTSTVGFNGIWVGGPASPSAHVVGGMRNGMCTDPAIDAHWNGASWTNGSVPSGCAFGGVWGNGLGFVAWPANEHKIVFTVDDAGSELSYQPAVTSNIYYRGIWGITKTLMWIVGDGGTIERFSVDKFNTGSVQAETSNVTVQLNGVGGTGSGDLWAVGNSGTILHSTGDFNWTKQTNVGAGTNFMSLQAVYALGPNDVYVVGSIMGTKLILHGQ